LPQPPHASADLDRDEVERCRRAIRSNPHSRKITIPLVKKCSTIDAMTLVAVIDMKADLFGWPRLQFLARKAVHPAFSDGLRNEIVQVVRHAKVALTQA